jgi:hypothetical protein
MTHDNGSDQMKYFNDLDEAVTYAVEELLATLEDDLERMSFAQEHLYSDEDREEEKARLEDVRAVAPIMVHAPEMLAALKDCLTALNETPNFRIPALAQEVTQLIRRLEPDRS